MEIWYFDTRELPDAKEEVLLKQLPEFMISQIGRYKSVSDRKARPIARLMVRDYFIENGYSGNWYDWERNEFEKPYILNGPFFNISHSGTMVVVAFDKDQEIGVDIEKMEETDMKEISDFFHPDEINMLTEYEYDTKLFYATWTRKEALLKACGKGITQGLDQISILGDILLLDKSWYLRTVNISAEYKCALCSPNEWDQLTIRRRSF